MIRTQPRWVLALIKMEQPKHWLDQYFLDCVLGNPSGVPKGEQVEEAGGREEKKVKKSVLRAPESHFVI